VGPAGADSRTASGRAHGTSPRWAKREAVARDVYLGGLGDRPASVHLRSRHRTAEILSALGPPLTYFRAGMIVGAESESYRTLRYLVQRLPAMIGPAWLKTPTQAIAIRRRDRLPDGGARRPRLGGPRGADRRYRRPLKIKVRTRSNEAIVWSLLVRAGCPDALVGARGYRDLLARTVPLAVELRHEPILAVRDGEELVAA
jgi:hypothetical protein